VNCGNFPDICDAEEVMDTPVVRIYPPQPIPKFDVDELLTRKIARMCARYIRNNVI